MSENFTIPLRSGLTYHIFNCGNNGENLFVEERNYDYFLRKYVQHIAPMADTFAWRLMPNHFHVLLRFKDYLALHEASPKRFLEPPAGVSHRERLQTVAHCQYDEKISEELSQVFANFFAGYAQAINKAYRRNGKLFALLFKRIWVEHETYFEWLIAYIHRNPVHHRFCKDFGEWKYSSFHEISAAWMGASPVSAPSANRSLHSPPLCDVPFLKNWFVNYDAFDQLHQASIQDMLDKRFCLEA
jgi:REP element-mobilizing transposase RayT